MGNRHKKTNSSALPHRINVVRINMLKNCEGLRYNGNTGNVHMIDIVYVGWLHRALWAWLSVQLFKHSPGLFHSFDRKSIYCLAISCLQIHFKDNFKGKSIFFSILCLERQFQFRSLRTLRVCKINLRQRVIKQRNVALKNNSLWFECSCLQLNSAFWNSTQKSRLNVKSVWGLGQM